MNEQRHSNGRDLADLIDLRDDHQVRQWTEILDVSQEYLALAVHIAGPKAASVKRFVREQKGG